MEIVAGEESVYRILAFVAMKMEVSRWIFHTRKLTRPSDLVRRGHRRSSVVDEHGDLPLRSDFDQDGVDRGRTQRP
jgi:hypothetical protein